MENQNNKPNTELKANDISSEDLILDVLERHRDCMRQASCGQIAEWNSDKDCSIMVSGSKYAYNIDSPSIFRVNGF